MLRGHAFGQPPCYYYLIKIDKTHQMSNLKNFVIYKSRFSCTNAVLYKPCCALTEAEIATIEKQAT